MSIYFDEISPCWMPGKKAMRYRHSNIHNAETIQGDPEVCSEMRSPVIPQERRARLSISRWRRSMRHAALTHYLRHAAGAASRSSRIAGRYYRKVNAGVRSAMIDGSHFPVCRERPAGEIGRGFCHARDCSVEAEPDARAAWKMI